MSKYAMKSKGESDSPFGNMKVVEQIDSTGRTRSYFNMTKNLNRSRLQQVINGMQDVKDICYLQVSGKNQFEKEIEEIKYISNKVIDMQALHRNE